MDQEKYLFTNTLCIGRGCPWRCDFCYNSSPNVDARYRMKTVRQVLREIDSLGTRHVMFIDDNFIGNPDGARRLLEAFRGHGLIWHAAVSADIGNREELLDLMAETGCKSLFIGFETLNQDNLRCCRKTQNRVQQYDDVVRRIHARGMMLNASLVFGFDGDSVETFDDTLSWLVRNRIATMTAHILTPYPGTRLYARLLEEGRIIDHDLSRYNTSHAVFRPTHMSADELEHRYRDLYRSFYAWPNMVRRWPVSGSQVAAYLAFNLVYRKYGGLTSRFGKAAGMRRLARWARWACYPGSGHDPLRRRKCVMAGPAEREAV